MGIFQEKKSDTLPLNCELTRSRIGEECEREGAQGKQPEHRVLGGRVHFTAAALLC